MTWANVYELTKFKLPQAKVSKVEAVTMAKCANCGVMDYLEPSQIGRVRRCTTCGMLYMAERRANNGLL